MEIGSTLFYCVIGIFSGILFVCVAYRFLKAYSDSSSDHPGTLVRVPHYAGEERRVHPRVEVHWSVSLETPEGAAEAELMNISLEGAFICCEKPLPIGEVFPLTLMAPDLEPLAAKAQVVWNNANVPREKVIHRGMGVRFLHMSERHLQMVRHLSDPEDRTVGGTAPSDKKAG